MPDDVWFSSSAASAVAVVSGRGCSFDSLAWSDSGLADSSACSLLGRGSGSALWAAGAPPSFLSSLSDGFEDEEEDRRRLFRYFDRYLKLTPILHWLRVSYYCGKARPLRNALILLLFEWKRCHRAISILLLCSKTRDVHPDMNFMPIIDSESRFMKWQSLAMHVLFIFHWEEKIWFCW